MEISTVQPYPSSFTRYEPHPSDTPAIVAGHELRCAKLDAQQFYRELRLAQTKLARAQQSIHDIQRSRTIERLEVQKQILLRIGSATKSFDHPDASGPLTRAWLTGRISSLTELGWALEMPAEWIEYAKDNPHQPLVAKFL